MEEKRTEHRLESKWQALIMTGIVLAAALLFLYSFLGGKKKETQPITRSDFALDTFITVTLYYEKTRNNVNGKKRRGFKAAARVFIFLLRL